MIKFECDTCLQEYKVRDERAGQVLKCKSCGHKMRVPAGEDDLLDEMYDDFEAPTRPTRKKKPSGTSKKKNPEKKTNSPLNIIAGVIAFGVALYFSSTFVSGLFGKKEKEEAADPPAIVQNEADNSSIASDTKPATATSPQQASTEANSFGPPPLTPQERNAELTRLRKQMKVYSEAIKTATPEGRKDLLAKMETTLARVKELTGKSETKTAQSGNPGTPAKPAPTVAPPKWTSLVDPPLVVADWPESSKLSIDLRNIDSKKLIPNSFSPFIGLRDRGREVYQIDVWNLATEKKTGQIAVKIESNWRVSPPIINLSTDGKYLLLAFVTKDTKTPKLASWDVATGQKLAEWEAAPADSHLSKFEICGSTFAFAKLRSKTGNKIQTLLKVWDLTSGKLISEKEVQATDFSEQHYKISPGGKYVFTYNLRNQIAVYDLQTLEQVQTIVVPDLLKATGSEFGRDSYYIYNGMNFSVDGKELGLLLSSSDGTSVWTMDLASGKTTNGYHITGALRDALSDPSYSGDHLVWFPKGEGWLLYGAWFVDRQRKQVLWTLKPVPRVIVRNEVYVTPNYLLAETATALRDEKGRPLLNRKPKLVPVRIPEQKLSDSLAAYSSQGDAILSAGQEISIDVNIGNLKFGNNDEVKTVLTEVLQQRLESDGFKVTADQPLVLKIEYQEQDGNKLKMTQRGRPTPGNPLGRVDTGQTLQSTAAAFKLSWFEKTSKRTLWSKEAYVNPRFLILRDATAEEARKKMFEGLQNRLMAESIPYFIPKDKKLSLLPLEIKLPE
ncbi:hypothetical protein [Gimesia fumaroli]|uniref:Uncharacterized protein n=1 Tax=Gimesia fumaroli TaxID=2527976 RepID=A0A518IHM2_9PLAN|nr:hypothetical protein [Gimesia fumaroli]QDV52592.1 hypothetical protein Enr17x_46550 [Gimesia fumaroli]